MTSRHAVIQCVISAPGRLRQADYKPRPQNKERNKKQSMQCTLKKQERAPGIRKDLQIHLEGFLFYCFVFLSK